MPHRMSRLCNVGLVRDDKGVITWGTHREPNTRGHIMSANDIFLRAIQPVVDIFWTLVWSATGSTVSVPRPSAPDAA